ncbi:hypothetical protein E6C27_scaffold44986G00010 [Cucumis melo var. makuwa]|uniref:Uncharacterized protein n=2 Tax=Cucumis melo var. makuwa TaxID=1194695 RepID=A0A5A7U2J7_CUCMM|nr:hypothetical protein E6C27_scaffold44986G00010 [Cucumis melo var. makuwa]
MNFSRSSAPSWNLLLLIGMITSASGCDFPPTVTDDSEERTPQFRNRTLFLLVGMCKWGEETIPILTSTPSILFLIQDRIQSPTALRKFFAPNYGSSPYLVEKGLKSRPMKETKSVDRSKGTTGFVLARGLLARSSAEAEYRERSLVFLSDLNQEPMKLFSENKAGIANNPVQDERRKDV